MKHLLLVFLIYSSSVLAEFNRLNLVSVFKIDEIHESLKIGGSVTGEPSRWKTILGVHAMGSDLSILKYCLLYKPPMKPDQSFEGELKWVEIPFDMNCESGSNVIALKHWLNISLIKLSMKQSEVQVELNLKDSRRLRLQYQFYNLKLQNSKKELFSKSETMRRIPGVIVLNKENKRENWERLKTFKARSFREVDLSKPCGGVKFDCSPIESKCEEICPSAWFWAPNGCPQGGARFCGEDHCGEKGWPACLRGFGDVGLSEKKDYKADQSFVFCSEGLHADPVGETIICD